MTKQAKTESSAIEALAVTLTEATIAAQPKPAVVALRGGPAISTVTLTGKPYRVTAPHNADWWAKLNATIATAGGTAQVKTLVEAGIPATHVGYLVRRGYLAGAA